MLRLLKHSNCRTAYRISLKFEGSIAGWHSQREHRQTGAAEQQHRIMVRTASSAGLDAATVKQELRPLESLKFDNVFARELPNDPNTDNRVRQVEGAMLTKVQPTPTGTEPYLIVGSNDMARKIGLSPEEFDRPEFAMAFSGNSLLPGSDPYAQCYGGHQFGSWAGQLGDGRAISLGEVVNGRERWELQLKGAGRTPYSRMADGRAVLRSSLREYVASEAMYALGVPTTRALSLVGTGDEVVRDMFYNGNAQLEPGAVVCRVARSFIRFGSFQLPASRGDKHLVKALADFTIREFYRDECTESENQYKQFLTAVARRTGFLVSEWHRVGFTHGVLNTDNMSIIGDTIDYGPYGWIERFDPNFTPNTTDLPGRRYCFQAQPEVGQWNIVQLARALVAAGLMNEEDASDAIAAYGQSLLDSYSKSMARKLGLNTYDADLGNNLLVLMYNASADYTNAFRALSKMDVAAVIREQKLPQKLLDSFGDDFKEESEWLAWMTRYKSVLESQGQSEEDRRRIQMLANPAIVPRNHVMVSIISDVEQGNHETLCEYLKALESPYVDDGLEPEWLEPAPVQPRLGVELLSCSS